MDAATTNQNLNSAYNVFRKNNTAVCKVCTKLHLLLCIIFHFFKCFIKNYQHSKALQVWGKQLTQTLLF